MGVRNARSEQQGRFSADTVELWLGNLSNELMDYLASQHPHYRFPSVFPERMHAAGHVMFNTPQLRAHVTDMQVWFRYPEMEMAREQLASNSPPADSPTPPILFADAAQGAARPFTTQPGGPSHSSALNAPSLKREGGGQASPLGTAFSSLAAIADGTSRSKPESPRLPNGPGQLAASNREFPGISLQPTDSAPALPMNVTGETLVARLTQTSQGMFVDDLALSGSVTVTRDQASAASPWPLTITGSQLRMDSSDEGRLDATIVGSPAKFAIGSGAIESDEIRFNERRQMIWIDRPGSFRIPPEAMQSLAAMPNPPNTPSNPSNSMLPPGLIASRQHPTADVEWIEPPEIDWQGKMLFDGRTARMDGGVRLTGRVKTDAETIWHLDGRARELLFELQEPISIGSQPTHQAKIATIQLRHEVDIKSAQTDVKGERRQLDHLEVPDLTILVPQHQWIGAGPGSLRSRRIGNATPLSPKFVNSGKLTEAPSIHAQQPQAELQCLHLRFRGRMEGDMNQQLVSFQDGVETLLQPILTWDDSPDVLRVERLKLGQTMMTCNQLSVYNTAKLSWNQTQIANERLRRDAAWEITAAGQVVVENVSEQGTFAAMASRAQYSAIHSVLRIEGAPREPAVIEQLPLNHPTNQPPVRLELSSAAINLKTGEIDHAQISSIRANLSELNPRSNLSPNPPPTTLPNGPSPSLPGYSNAAPSIPSPRDSYPLRRQ